MTEQTVKLDANKILTTTSRRILFDCLLKGMSIKDAAPQAKLGVKYAQNIVGKCGITDLVKQQTAITSAKVGITVELQQLALMADIESAREAHAWGAVMSGRATLLKSIGGMTGERPHPETIAMRDRDGHLLAKMREFADRFYADKYLAKPIEQVTVLDLRPLAGPGGEDNSQKEQNVQGQEQAERSGSGTNEAAQGATEGATS